jgi:hypothetical protein
MESGGGRANTARSAGKNRAPFWIWILTRSEDPFCKDPKIQRPKDPQIQNPKAEGATKNSSQNPTAQ